MYLMPQELKFHCSFPTEVVDLILEFPLDSGNEDYSYNMLENVYYFAKDFFVET